MEREKMKAQLQVEFQESAKQFMMQKEAEFQAEFTR